MPGAIRATGWSEKWLTEEDGNRDQISEWAEKETQETFRCNWCKTSGLFFKNQGLLQIKQHALGKKHRTVADIKKRRNRSQQVLISSSVAEDVANNNCDEVEGGNRI